MGFSSLADSDGTEIWLVIQVEAGFLAVAEYAADVGTVDAPRKMSEAVARSGVVEAVSWLAGVPGALMGEGDSCLDSVGTMTLFTGALLKLAGDIVDAAPVGLEDKAVLKGISEIGTALSFPPPGTQPGTRFAGLAGAGPSVTATQPGKFDNTFPGSTFS